MSHIDHHHPGCDNEHHKHHHHWDHHAPECDDQLPLFAHAGRGIKGDSYKIEEIDPSCIETYLKGSYYDEATKTWHTDWVSQNINGGELSYQYNLRPYTNPRTFTITFLYRRPNNPPAPGTDKRKHTGIPSADGNNGCAWTWTTPAIPYIWTLDPDGKPDTDPDHVVGSGVATLFVRASKNEAWNPKDHERLWYPEGTTRDNFNAPLAEKAWSATITFGFDGDVKLPNFDDLAKIIGCTKDDIFNILQDNSVHWGDIDADNLLDYINKCDKRDRDHFHADLGFNEEGHASTGAFGGQDTVKKYIDWKFEQLENKVNNQFNVVNGHIKNLYGLVDDLIKHIYGATKVQGAIGSSTSYDIPDEEGFTINWSPNATIPQSNMNVYGGDDKTSWIKSHKDATDDDVWAR